MAFFSFCFQAFKTAGDLSAPSVNVEFTMRLTYRTAVLKSSKDTDGNAEGKLVGKGWDADCSWGEWHALDDPVKGSSFYTYWSEWLILIKGIYILENTVFSACKLIEGCIVFHRI